MRERVMQIRANKICRPANSADIKPRAAASVVVAIAARTVGIRAKVASMFAWPHLALISRPYLGLRVRGSSCFLIGICLLW